MGPNRYDNQIKLSALISDIRFSWLDTVVLTFFGDVFFGSADGFFGSFAINSMESVF